MKTLLNSKKAPLLAVCLTCLLVALLQGCSTGDSPMTSSDRMQTECLDGVTYYLYRENAGYSGWGYMSVKFNKDGSVALCN